MSEVLRIARQWIGTPYQHQASLRGAGCDCLGLVRGVYAELTGETVSTPAYSPDWAERLGRETLLDAAWRYLTPIANDAAEPGDVLAFRLRPDLPVTHVGILSAPDRFIHAYAGRAVTESAFVAFWRRRHSHSFRLPFIERSS